MKTKLGLVLTVALLTSAFSAATADEAKQIFDNKCAKCHGEDGKGDTKMGKKAGAKDFTDAQVQAKLEDEAMAKAIKEGVKDGDKTKMKAFADLTDAQIQALVAYVRAFKK